MLGTPLCQYSLADGPRFPLARAAAAAHHRSISQRDKNTHFGSCRGGPAAAVTAIKAYPAYGYEYMATSCSFMSSVRQLACAQL